MQTKGEVEVGKIFQNWKTDETRANLDDIEKQNNKNEEFTALCIKDVINWTLKRSKIEHKSHGEDIEHFLQ